MLDDLPLGIHMVLRELAGDHTYEFAARLDRSDKYPSLCGVGRAPPLAAAPYSIISTSSSSASLIDTGAQR